MKINFCSMALVGAACVGTGLVVTAATGQSGGDSAEAHIEAARRAAGPEYLPVFNGLCRSLTPQPAPQPAPAVKPAPASSADPPPRAQWHVEPMKVFDNLYYLGQSEYTAWAITTSAGIIVTDPLFEYSVEDEVVNGLTKLGLDPRQIKVRPRQPRASRSRWRGEAAPGSLRRQGRHVGRRLGPRSRQQAAVSQAETRHGCGRRSATDARRHVNHDVSHTGSYSWNHLDADPGEGSRPAAHRRSMGRHGIELHHHSRTREAILVRRLARSATRFSDVVAKSGADVQIANHPNQDGAAAKLAALANRKPGEPHPFVIGNANILRYLTMVRECAQAGLATTR